MKLKLTLREALYACRDWLEFCRMTGYDEYAVAEGGGEIEVTLTLEQAVELGIVRLP